MRADRDAGRGAEAVHVLIVDNYDSFTHNLVQAIASSGARVTVFRNDAVTVDVLERNRPGALIVSPGPGGPEPSGDGGSAGGPGPVPPPAGAGGTGIAAAALERFRGRIPVLGVCLGHQLIAVRLGGRVERAPEPVFGKRTPIRHTGEGIFAGLPSPFSAARYHALVVADAGPSVRPLAWSEDGLIMALGVPGEPTWGVQFHPESFMTPEGNALLGAFLGGIPCPEGAAVP